MGEFHNWIRRHEKIMFKIIVSTILISEVLYSLTWLIYLFIKRKYLKHNKIRYRPLLLYDENIPYLTEDPEDTKVINLNVLIRLKRTILKPLNIIIALVSVVSIILLFYYGSAQIMIKSILEWLAKFPLIGFLKKLVNHIENCQEFSKYDQKKYVYTGHILMAFVAIILSIYKWIWNERIAAEIKENRESFSSSFRLIFKSFCQKPKRLREVFRKVNSIILIFVASVSIATIIEMNRGVYPTRWHHISYGILLMLSCSKSLSICGFFLIVDSIEYWTFKHSSNFGVDNVILEHFEQIFLLLFFCLVFEAIIYKKYCKIEQKLETIYL